MDSVKNVHLPFWSFTGTYFFMFAIIGGLAPYFPLYLESLGASPEVIGWVIAVSMVGRVGIPFVVAWLADVSGKHLFFIRASSVASAAVFSGLCLFELNIFWIGFLLFLFSAIWGALVPQVDALTFAHLKHQKHRYSRIRIWGSIGFILTSMLLGYSIERLGIGLLLPALMLINLVSVLFVFRLPAAENTHSQQETSGFWKIAKQPHVIIVLAVAFLVLFSHGPYYTFFSVYLEEHDYSRTSIGVLWSLGVFAEVILFWMLPNMMQRISASQLLLGCVFLTLVRWIVIAFAIESIAWVVFAQVLHAASYAGYHAAIVTLISLYFKGSFSGRGQALYNSMSFGLGSTIGSLSSGYLWGAWGGKGTFLMAAAASLIALGLSALILVKHRGVEQV